MNLCITKVDCSSTDADNKRWDPSHRGLSKHTPCLGPGLFYIKFPISANAGEKFLAISDHCGLGFSGNLASSVPVLVWPPVKAGRVGCNSCQRGAAQRVSLGKLAATQGLGAAPETRDPLSAARSWCSFMSSPVHTRSRRKSVLWALPRELPRRTHLAVFYEALPICKVMREPKHADWKILSRLKYLVS